MDSLFRGLNRQLLPNSHIFSLAAVESTVVSILPGAPFPFIRATCGAAPGRMKQFPDLFSQPIQQTFVNKNKSDHRLARRILNSLSGH